jgi:hypothetical protein
MMGPEKESVPDLIALRVRVENLEQDLSQALHLFYCQLIWTATSQESEFKRRGLALLRAKLLQLPQGSRLGQALIKLDEQFGNKLESHGVNLKVWVYEPRERRDE